jgi:DNA-binding NtrC family response regulator
LRYREIDAVVLDMIMPGMNGRATYRAMREVDPSVPVLLTTGYALNEEAQSIIDLGVRELLEKPYDADGLIAALGRILRPQST